VELFAEYQKHYEVAPRVFSFDLKGYPDVSGLQFLQERVFCLGGSERVLDIMQKLDRDLDALVREVEAVSLDRRSAKTFRSPHRVHATCSAVSRRTRVLRIHFLRGGWWTEREARRWRSPEPCEG
jgi:hypothetical protein